MRRILAGAVFVLAFMSSSAAPAADATAFDPLMVTVEAQAISGVPIGTIIAWPVANNPEGWSEGNWLECNGQSISPTVYPELCAVVGGRVPDLRGLFLRGYGVRVHTQHNGSTVGITATTHTSGALGVVQGDTTRNINCRSGYYDYNMSTVPYAPNGAFYATAVVDGAREDGRANTIQMDISRVVPTSNEIRPVNQAVRYLIRAR